MRRFLIVLATLVVCSAPTWAKSIELDVNAWATITAPPNCPSCVEKIDVNYLWLNPADPNTGIGQIVPGSVNVTSSGFLGTFSGDVDNAFYLGLFNNPAALVPTLNPPPPPTDEIDLYHSGGENNVLIYPGKNTLSFDFYGCATQECTSAYGTSWEAASPLHLNIQQGSNVTQVPDGDSLLPLSLSAFGAFAMAWRWRRREV